MATTGHTYAPLAYAGGRLARTDWPGLTADQAVEATLRYEPEAIILVAADATRVLRGYAPGGMAA